MVRRIGGTMRALLQLLVFGLVAFLGAPSALAATKEVVIVTSFPKELFEAYKKAFEAARPGVRVVVKPQQTNAAITYLRETRAKPDADIFWASAVDAFQVLKADGLLEKVALPDALLSRIPKTIGTFPIHDPDGHYFGFAVSGYGLMWNTRYLALHKLPQPKEWTDLTDGRYHGHLDLRPKPERHHAPHHRGDSAGVRLGEGMGPPPPDGRQYGVHHRAELRRARGHHLRTVRDRSRDRLLWSLRYRVGTSRRLRLSGADLRGAGLGGGGQGRPERGECARLRRVPPVRRGPAPPVLARDRPAAGGSRPVRQGSGGLSQPLHDEARRGELQRQAVVLPAKRGELPIRSSDHVPPRRAPGGLGGHRRRRECRREGEGGRQEGGAGRAVPRGGEETGDGHAARCDARFGQGDQRRVQGQARRQVKARNRVGQLRQDQLRPGPGGSRAGSGRGQVASVMAQMCHHGNHWHASRHAGIT